MFDNGKTYELMRQFEEMGVPSIDCAVYHKGKCVFRHKAGFSDVERTKPVDGSERYNIYSCSKPITCTAALQLVEKGTIKLDDAVGDYIPAFRSMKKLCDGKTEDVKNTMTIRHLFTMTAGLGYGVATDAIKRGKVETNGRMATLDAMEYIAEAPLYFEPGEQWNYSLCHDVLAAVVEAASGERFGEYVRKNIFEPLGMKHSTFLLPENELDTLTAQYCYDAEKSCYNSCGPQIQFYKLGSEYESGGAGCISTVDDYIAFLEGLRCGETLLRRETVAMMSSPQLNSAQQNTFTLPDYSYGLGVRCPKADGVRPDFGWGGAAGAFLAILPEQEISIYHAQHVLYSPNQTMRYQLVDAVCEDMEV